MCPWHRSNAWPSSVGSDDGDTWPESRPRWRVASPAAPRRAGPGSGGGTDNDEEEPCAGAFRITEESVRFPNGSVPEVRLRLGNTGDDPIEYDLNVIFEQATSTGIYAKSGRDTLSGKIIAGGSVVVTATADGLDARSTDRYDVEVSLACPSR